MGPETQRAAAFELWRCTSALFPDTIFQNKRSKIYRIVEGPLGVCAAESRTAAKAQLIIMDSSSLSLC